MVKNFFRSGNLTGNIEKDFFGNPQVPFRLINRAPLYLIKKKIERNVRARSAKLRIAEKL
jgi:16S rRNA (cytosine1402-N4)-methyltransferase